MLNYWPRGGMVDTKDLKSLPYGSAGSSPAEATKVLLKWINYMFAFVTIGTNDLKSSAKFYDKILLPFHIVKVDSDERYVGYANINYPEKIELYIMKPYNKETASIGNGTMITFLADSKRIVDQFYAIGLENGGIDEGSPDHDMVNTIMLI